MPPHDKDSGDAAATTAAAATILTEATVASYVSNRRDAIGVFPDGAKLSATAIAGGNVNYAFRVAEEEEEGATSASVEHDGGGGDDAKKKKIRTVFVKQAPEYVAIFGPDGLPLTSLRMQKEVEVYNEWGEILGDELCAKYLPELYLFDDENKVFVMEFFEGFTLLDHDLVEKGALPPSIATGLGEFMGLTHAATHSGRVSADRASTLATSFENRAMRDVQLEYVFTKCYVEATDEQRAGLTVDDKFLAEVEALKKSYDGKGDPKNLALCHGDLHPGSVMVNAETGEVKVIDPEFTVYGPPGLDVGSLLSGYVLAAVHQAHSNRPDAVQALREASVAVWDAYRSAMAKGGVSDETVLRQIEVDTVGFTVAEVCRTALGFAGGRLWLQFEDENVKKEAVRAAMRIVETCMTGRHTGGIQQLFSEMEALSVN